MTEVSVVSATASRPDRSTFESAHPLAGQGRRIRRAASLPASRIMWPPRRAWQHAASLPSGFNPWYKLRAEKHAVQRLPVAPFRSSDSQPLARMGQGSLTLNGTPGNLVVWASHDLI